MKKTIEENFRDWESNAFGFGYGTGEFHTVTALKKFLSLVPEENAYNYVDMEKNLGSCVAWLLINTLCKANILEYGTSPRNAWMTPEGIALKAFTDKKTDEELLAICCDYTVDYTHCYPDACNCGEGFERGKVCMNPFWRRRK